MWRARLDRQQPITGIKPLMLGPAGQTKNIWQQPERRQATPEVCSCIGVYHLFFWHRKDAENKVETRQQREAAPGASRAALLVDFARGVRESTPTFRADDVRFGLQSRA
jgi:hypothetical protein